jgi:hypothetical protein
MVMTEVTLHAAPRVREILLEQVRFVASRFKREALALAVGIGILTALVGIDFASGHAKSWFDDDDWLVVHVLAFLFPFAVWWGEKRFGPAFIWTLPVDRRTMGLARVFGGWAWLMGAMAVLSSWRLALALLVGAIPAQSVSFPSFAAVTAMYLFGSALVLGLRHPIRWLITAGAILVLLQSALEGLGRTSEGQWRIFAWSGPVRWAMYGPFGLITLLNTKGVYSAIERADQTWGLMPVLAREALLTLVGVGTGMVALWAASLRHRERRRH